MPPPRLSTHHIICSVRASPTHLSLYFLIRDAKSLFLLLSVIVAGGSDAHTYFNELWSYSSTSAQQRTTCTCCSFSKLNPTRFASAACAWTQTIYTQVPSAIPSVRAPLFLDSILVVYCALIHTLPTRLQGRSLHASTFSTNNGVVVFGGKSATGYLNGASGWF